VLTQADEMARSQHLVRAAAGRMVRWALDDFPAALESRIAPTDSRGSFESPPQVGALQYTFRCAFGLVCLGHARDRALHNTLTARSECQCCSPLQAVQHPLTQSTTSTLENIAGANGTAENMQYPESRETIKTADVRLATNAIGASACVAA
jgi:hypothetical protein